MVSGRPSRPAQQDSPLRRTREARNWTLERTVEEIDLRTPDGRSGVTPSMLPGWELGQQSAMLATVADARECLVVTGSRRRDAKRELEKLMLESYKESRHQPKFSAFTDTGILPVRERSAERRFRAAGGCPCCVYEDEQIIQLRPPADGCCGYPALRARAVTLES